MKITKRWLQKMNACCSIEDMTKAEKIGDINLICKELLKLNRFKDANWLITKNLKKIDKIRYAVFAAEKVLYIFEKKYSNDNRPRLAIKAAKEYIKNPTKKNKNDAYAAYAAAAAAYAAAAAAAAANAAVYAANAAAYAANAAANAYAAYAANAAANAYAANAAVYAANAADDNKLKTKIINYGLKLLK